VGAAESEQRTEKNPFELAKEADEILEKALKISETF
jgi:hypothetical protein